jgi:hypothetical protein
MVQMSPSSNGPLTTSALAFFFRILFTVAACFFFDSETSIRIFFRFGLSSMGISDVAPHFFFPFIVPDGFLFPSSL